MVGSRLSTIEARRFRGLFAVCPLRRGLRWRGSVDELAAAWTATGATITYEPIENGAVSSRVVGAFRTGGSPWTDVVERADSQLLTPALAKALSAHERAVMLYHYDSPSGHFQHELFTNGTVVESWSAPAEPLAQIEHYLDTRYRALQMRDWGVALDDLEALRLPFSPTLMVEAFFLSLDPDARGRLWERDDA